MPKNFLRDFIPHSVTLESSARWIKKIFVAHKIFFYSSADVLRYPTQNDSQTTLFVFLLCAKNKYMLSGECNALHSRMRNMTIVKKTFLTRNAFLIPQTVENEKFFDASLREAEKTFHLTRSPPKILRIFSVVTVCAWRLGLAALSLKLCLSEYWFFAFARSFCFREWSFCQIIPGKSELHRSIPRSP